MSLDKWLAKNGSQAKRLASELGHEISHGEMGKDLMLGAAFGAPLEAATRNEDESLPGSLGKGAVKGSLVNAGTMSLLRRLGL